MSIQNIQIDGNGSFYDTAENAGVVAFATFGNNAVNTGTVTEVAVFAGDAVNTGTVAVAEFNNNAVNAGTVSTSAVFADSTSNTGTVAAAEFINNAKNDGGTVTGVASFADTAENIGSVGGNAVFADSAQNKGAIAGDAVFADTTVNTGSVAGNAEVAPTADNSGGTVTGSVTEYVPPSQYPAVGTVLSAGVVNYATVGVDTVENGTYDVIANGNGGSTNGNYQYPSAGTSEISSKWYTFDGNGGASYAAAGIYTLPDGLWYTFDGNGGRSFASAGTYQANDGSWYTFDGNGGGVQLWVSNGVPAVNEQYNLQGDGTWHFYINGVDGGVIPLGIPHLSMTGSWYIYYGDGGGVYATGITTDDSGTTYHKYDGSGGRSQVYQLTDINNVTYYASSSILAIGTYTYTSYNIINTTNITIGDMYYNINSDGMIYSIVDTDPYN